MRRITVVWVFACACVAGRAMADPPDAKVNPQSGLVEVVDSHLGSSYDIRHTIEHDPPEQSVATEVSTDSANEYAPRIKISGAGDTFVVWYRDQTTDEVRVRRHDYSDNSWGTDTRISDPGENSRNPEIEYAAGTPWVVYEIEGSSNKSIAIVGISDGPEPIVPTRTIVRTTSYSGNLDATIRAQSGHLWITWVDGATSVGWSEYDSGEAEWSTPEYESYQSDTVYAARQRIHDTVLGL